MGSMKKGPSEGGSGGKRGHSNMEHRGYNDEVKVSARRRRRRDAKKMVAEVKQRTDDTDVEPRLRAEFDDPQDGWIGIKVSIAQQEFSESVSCTPNDFLLELASAVSLSLQGQVGVAVASTEPLYYDFVFTPQGQTGTTRFEIIEHLNIRWKRGRTVFSFEAQSLRIARPFWKALRDVEMGLTTEEYREVMRRDFPSAEVRRLGEHIRSM